MKKLLFGAAVAVLVTGCMSIESRLDRARFGENPYVEPPFYSRYLDTRTPLDQRIEERISDLAADPNSPALHNELGALLIQKGFPNDAAREFKRALYIDDEFYPAWYNLGLLYHARGASGEAIRALKETVDLKPGHAHAHFLLGLIYEERGSNDAAIERYTKAFTINPNLLEVGVNPRIVDSKLVARALLNRYPLIHRSKSIQAQGAPRDYVPPATPEAPSPQERPQDIVTPAPPPTEQGIQSAPPAPEPTPDQ